MADQIFEIKFHNLFGYKFGRIVDEAHNIYSGDEGWATKDEVNAFMNKFLEALNKESLRRVNRQKYKRCMAMAALYDGEYYTAKFYHEDDKLADQCERRKKKWLEIAENFKEIL